MEEFDNAIDSDNDISYGISSKGHEVMIVNEREIFVKRKIGKRTLNNNYTIGWSCKNKPSYTASISSTRDDVNLEASDYNIERKNQHSIFCSISRTDVVVLKHLNYLMEQCKEPGVSITRSLARSTHSFMLLSCGSSNSKMGITSWITSVL